MHSNAVHPIQTHAVQCTTQSLLFVTPPPRRSLASREGGLEPATDALVTLTAALLGAPAGQRASPAALAAAAIGLMHESGQSALHAHEAKGSHLLQEDGGQAAWRRRASELLDLCLSLISACRAPHSSHFEHSSHPASLARLAACALLLCSASRASG